MMLNVCCNGVWLYSWFSTTRASAPFFSSTTIRVCACRPDSFRTSEMSLIRSSRTASTIRSTSVFCISAYGISSIISDSRPVLLVSTWHTPRTITRPRPSLYASKIPRLPRITPPVGKSGPLRPCRSTAPSSPTSSAISSGSVISGWSSTRVIESRISTGLCGGRLVAMPTAMPMPPFTSKFGNLPGSTIGSCKRSS